MTNNGPMTVGPADDDMEKQAGENTSSAPSNAYTLTFEEQQNQRLQRDMMDHRNLGSKADTGSLELLGI